LIVNIVSRKLGAFMKMRASEKDTHMVDSHPDPDTGDDDTGVGPDRESTTGTPRWVKVSAIVALVVVLLVVGMLVFGGGPGGHGPGRHTGGGDTPAAGGDTRGRL
jgi:hypothetical protein